MTKTRFIKFHIHGRVATYTVQDGWTCDDALVQKHLRAECSPTTPNFTDAAKLVKEQYGESAEEVKPDRDEDPQAGAAVPRQYDEVQRELDAKEAEAKARREREEAQANEHQRRSSTTLGNPAE